MLRALHIENVAVIECADIDFGSGLTVFTGETGAGKSIVIDAINGVLGERLSRDIVRTGTEKAYISAVFDALSPEVTEALQEDGFAPDEDGTLLIQRRIGADGKGDCRIGGRPATVSLLRKIGRLLVNVHGQHENQNLLLPQRHLLYLDRLGQLEACHNAYEKEYQAYCRIQRTIKAMHMDKEEREFRLNKLSQQIEEVDAVRLCPGETEELEQKCRVVRHAEKLATLLQNAQTALQGDENGEGVTAPLSEAIEELRSGGTVSPALNGIADRLQNALYEIQAGAEEVRDRQKELNFSEEELARLEDRLATVRHILKKYGGSEEEVLRQKEEWEAQLKALTSNEETLADLQAESDKAREATIKASQTLTRARREAATKFEQDVCTQLQYLDMPHVKLVVSVEPTALTATGGDKVEFLISSNPGEPPKSIAHTASGGELSRIMLALKSVLADVDDVDTLIFDEIDTGISGHAATKVGALMRRISARRQVLCVTHLAQIASCGHTHLLVQKAVSDGRTYTAVEPLTEQHRLEELGRIIGGVVTEATLQTAKEMIIQNSLDK